LVSADFGKLYPVLDADYLKRLHNLWFTLVVLLLNQFCFGQDQLIWKSTLEDDTRDVFKSNYDRIVKGGYQLDLQELSNGRVIALFNDLSLLTKNIQNGSDGLSFNYQSTSGSESELLIDRNEIREQLRVQFRASLESRMSTMRFRGSAEDFRKEKTTDFERILRDKKSAAYWREYSWHLDLGTIADLGGKSPYSLSFVCKKIPYARISFDSLYSAVVTGLPQLDNERCQPFDRYTYFRKYFGYSYQGLKYPRYMPTSGIRKKKNFRLFFDKASAIYLQAGIDEIVKYLNDSNLVIQKAKVFAFASVEGDSANNVRLQQERATILLESLEKANNDSIEIDIHIREDWGLFEKQLEKSPFGGKYSKTEWKELFQNDSIERRFDKFLKQQRRAELYLSLTQRLKTEEKIALAFDDFHIVSQRYSIEARSDVRSNLAQRLYTIKRYLEMQAKIGNVSAEKVCALFPPGNYEYHIIQLYETAKMLHRDQEPVCQNLGEIIAAAQLAVVNLIHTNGQSRMYTKYGLDIQSFAYEMVAEGRIDPSILCQIDYPEEATYYNLILNRLYFIDHQGLSKMRDLPCHRASIFEKEPDVLLASLSTQVASKESPEEFYYFILKNIVLAGDVRVSEYIERSDHVYQFDLLEFLYINISNWQPSEGKLFDEDVTAEIMSLFLEDLFSMKEMICPNQISSIAIQYHLKVLYHSLNFGKCTDLTHTSLMFLSDYYQEHSADLSDQLALAIAKQFMALTPLYFRNEPATEAYNVLRWKDWKEPLRGEALNYYANLVDIVAPDRDSRMEIMKNKYPAEVWNSFFSGKYSIDSARSQ